MSESQEMIFRGLLAEYEHLKAEQRDRIGVRDNLVYASLIAQAGVVYAIQSSKIGPALFLLLPPVGFLLGWKYLTNDLKIKAIRRYIGRSLAPRLTRQALDPSLCGLPLNGGPLFAWEHEVVPRRRMRKSIQLLADLVAFVLLPLGALIWFAASTSPLPRPLVIISVLGGLLLALLANAFINASEIFLVPLPPADE